MSPAIIPPYLSVPDEPWKPVVPAFTCNEACRCPEHLRAAVAQFDVERARRYAPSNGATFCNIFVWDVTRALGCEVPHWCGDSGEPVPMGTGKELSANGCLDWLYAVGPERGWREVDAIEAELAASAGHPAIAAARMHPHGHIAVLLPSRPGEAGPRSAQAGGRCYYDEPVRAGFGLAKIHWFVHA